MYLDVKVRLSNKVLGTPPGGYHRNVVEMQLHTTFAD